MTINLRAFNNGELGPTLTGRSDLEKYYSSLKRVENAIVEKFGGVKGRPGTLIEGRAHPAVRQIFTHLGRIYLVFPGFIVERDELENPFSDPIKLRESAWPGGSRNVTFSRLSETSGIEAFGYYPSTSGTSVSGTVYLVKDEKFPVEFLWDQSTKDNTVIVGLERETHRVVTVTDRKNSDGSAEIPVVPIRCFPIPYVVDTSFVLPDGVPYESGTGVLWLNPLHTPYYFNPSNLFGSSSLYFYSFGNMIHDTTRVFPVPTLPTDSDSEVYSHGNLFNFFVPRLPADPSVELQAVTEDIGHRYLFTEVRDDGLEYLKPAVVIDTTRQANVPFIETNGTIGQLKTVKELVDGKMVDKLVVGELRNFNDVLRIPHSDGPILMGISLEVVGDNTNKGPKTRSFLITVQHESTDGGDRWKVSKEDMDNMRRGGVNLDTRQSILKGVLYTFEIRVIKEGTFPNTRVKEGGEVVATKGSYTAVSSLPKLLTNEKYIEFEYPSEDLAGVSESRLYKLSGNNEYHLLSISTANSPSYRDTGQALDSSITAPTYRDYPFSSVYPSYGGHFSQRFFLGGATSRPLRLWGTALGRPLSFTGGDSFNFDISAPLRETTRFLLVARNLVVGTSDGVHSVGESGFISPEEINARRIIFEGASNIPAVQSGRDVVYVHKNQLTVSRASFSEERGGETRYDLNKFHPTLFSKEATKIKQLAVTKDLNEVVWVLTESGLLMGCTFSEEDEVVAWHRHIVKDRYSGGEDKNAKILYMWTDTSSTRDKLYLLVERDNGNWIESIHPDNAPGMDAYYRIKVNGGVVTLPDGKDIPSGYPLNRLAVVKLPKDKQGTDAQLSDIGFVLNSIGDDNLVSFTRDTDMDSKTLNSVSSTLEDGEYLVGIPYVPEIQTLRIDTPDASATYYDQKVNVNRIAVTSLDTRGYTIVSENGVEIDQTARKVTDKYDDPISPRRDVDLVLLSGSYGRGEISIKQTRPMNFNILSVAVQGVSGVIAGTREGGRVG